MGASDLDVGGASDLAGPRCDDLVVAAVDGDHPGLRAEVPPEVCGVGAAAFGHGAVGVEQLQRLPAAAATVLVATLA